MTCGIYLLSFNNTHKVYIGQSINIEHRYTRHLAKLRSNTHSIKLNEAYKLYGIPDYEILEQCEENKLNELEAYHIKLWDAITDGFNSAELIGVYNKQNGDTNPASKYTNNQIEEVFDYLLHDSTTPLNYIKEDTGVSIGVIYAIGRGELHKWLSTKPDYDKMLLMYKNRYTKEDTTLIESIFNNLVEDSSITYSELVNKYKVSYQIIASLATGHGYTWLKEKYPEKYNLLEVNRNVRKTKSNTITCSKRPKILLGTLTNGHIIENIYNMTEFSKKYGIDLSSVSRLINNKAKTAKGWRLV